MHSGEISAAAEGSAVARVARSGFRTAIEAGGHALVADEPAHAGGTGLGPSPYGLLSAALAACTVMTLRMYAERKGWPLESATAEVTHAKIHVEDCADCESRTGLVDRFERVVRLEGPLDEDQRRRLLEIAERCPVHRTLTGEIKVRTRLAGS